MNRVLTIVGSSARAAAFSAVRAGCHVRAADLFADVDLCRICADTRVGIYPAGLAAVVRGPQGGAWMYTGALENHPSLVDAMARARPLWGNPADVLCRVRSPRLVAETLRKHGLSCPRVTMDSQAVPRDGSWLSKPCRSAGGVRIAVWDHNSPAASRSHGRYFQQFIEGTAYSAVYVAARGHARLLGVTRQLIGQSWTGATGFRYCGSIGPIELPAAATDRFAAIGEVLAGEFKLVGLFGVDAIVNSAGVWPVEVNPRYTASVEILERAGGVRAIELHAAACEENELPKRVERTNGPVSGKAIVFASSQLEISAAWTDRALAANDDRRPMWADIPAEGSMIEPGWPIVTVLVDAPDEAAVDHALRENAEKVRAQLRVG
ncbi:MAG: ATP-grasp domain-containing protein [Pirellulales bacterium]